MCSRNLVGSQLADEPRQAAAPSPHTPLIASKLAPTKNMACWRSVAGHVFAQPCRSQLAGEPHSVAVPSPHPSLIASKLAPTKMLTCKGPYKAFIPENENAPHRRGVSLYGRTYCASVLSADSPASASGSAAGAASFSSPLMPSNSRSKTNTELAGISGLGLCSP